MSNTEYSEQSLRNGATNNGAIPTEISCVFKLGKEDQNDQSIDFDMIDELENDEMFIHREKDELTLNSVAAKEAIETIKSRLKTFPSLQVHSFDGLPISVFNNEAAPSLESVTYTEFETSVDLPPADTAIIQQHIGDDHHFSEFDSDPDFFKNLLSDSFFIDLIPTTNTENNMKIDEDTLEPSLTSTSFSDPVSEQPEVETSSFTAHRPSVSSMSTFSDYVDHEETVETPKSTKSNGAGSKFARFGNKKVVKYSQEYHERRVRNNLAVKNSRIKAKEKQKTTESQMSKLIAENQTLHDRVDLLMNELQVLRSLYKELKGDQTVGRVQTRSNMATQ